MHSYPKNFLPWLWSITGALVLTGLFLIPGALELRLEWEVPFNLGTSRIAVAALHAFAAFAALVAIGALLPVHMRLGLRQHRNHASGLMLVSWLVLLALTALGIYYLAQPTLSVIVSMTHLLLGLGLVVPLGWHWYKGAQLRRQRALALRVHHGVQEPHTGT